MALRIRGVATFISTLLLVTTVILWLRSCWRADIGGLLLHQGRVQAAASCRGKVYFFFSDLQLGEERAWTLDAESGDPDEFLRARDGLLVFPALDRVALGFRLAKAPPKAMWVPATYWIVVLPHWFITIVFAILPAVWLRHRLRLRRRVKRRLCRRCGYDLRFSAGRCPECGEAIDGEATVPA